MKTKIIFCDFDGVLNNWEYFRSEKTEVSFNSFDPKNVAELNRIIQETGAKIVVSSAWRLGHSITELRKIFLQFGVNAEIIDKTTSDPGRREMQIAKWIFENKPKHYIIFDDDTLIGFDKQFIHTDLEDGLTKELADLAISILNEKE